MWKGKKKTKSFFLSSQCAASSLKINIYGRFTVQSDQKKKKVKKMDKENPLKTRNLKKKKKCDWKIKGRWPKWRLRIMKNDSDK